MSGLLSDADMIERVLDHIDNKTTDVGDEDWQEPTDNYRSVERHLAELELLKRLPVPFCPSVALPDTGSYVARSAAGTPLVVVRGEDGTVRAFRNACRHRGNQVAKGSDCVKAFVCGYHGWTYGLNGRLRHIPHDSGFPDLEKSEHSLAPVDACERHGLVFVTQEQPVGDGALEGLDGVPELFTPDQRIFATADKVSDVNWKLNMEGNLEGYHIKPTHRETFYPYGFDNLNVVETFGNNSRVTFPFRRIEKLRDLPADSRNIAGMVTYVYHLFPNVSIAVLSNHTTLSISEPLSPTQTRFITYRLTN
ncbi:MAG: aromatic ring-hydroxylating dioxygenase subunit alpha, partial [Gammaproteobacteria bacterium]|nr:aromatic ring-hydroxylating dioxygenase subunit alpha [Gammaproteobacteria bacterium]